MARQIGRSPTTLRRVWDDAEEFLVRETKVSFKTANRITRQELLDLILSGKVVSACFAFYAITDLDLCLAIITLLLEFKIPVRVIFDRAWTRSCPKAIECIKLLIAGGAPPPSPHALQAHDAHVRRLHLRLGWQCQPDCGSIREK